MNAVLESSHGPRADVDTDASTGDGVPVAAEPR
jgi:hypothetical protein